MTRAYRIYLAAAAVVALHVADDSFLQPNPGTSAGDHVVAGLVPIALLGVGAWLFPRVRAGAQGAIALLAGYLGVLVGTEAVYYTTAVGPSGDDFTGLLAAGAGLVLVGLGAWTLFTHRRRDGRVWWRYGRPVLVLAGVYVAVSAFFFAFSLSYVITHTARAHVPKADLGAPYEDVAFETSDGLTLRGWYIRSRNGAAVISFPGRASSQKRAKMLARHGYGVLVFDRRGEGESDGDPNLFGWQGERDIHGAVKYLQSRPDVDPERIGGIGLSVGGEMMIEAAAESSALKAIVSEGASGRSIRDDLAGNYTSHGVAWQNLVGDTVATFGTALFTDNVPPADLRSLARKIHGAAFFVYGGQGQPAERPGNRVFYSEAPGPKEIWEVPGSGHIGGIDAQPRAYETRVVGFFDRYLRDR